MSEFLSQNLATIIVSLILAAAIVLVVRKLYKDRKAGKSSCGCNCSGCPGSSMCHSKKQNKQ